MALLMRLASGTTQWKRTRALQEIASCEKGAMVRFAVDSGGGARQASVQCAAAQPPAEHRPAAVAELSSRVWYVDVTRAPMTQITPVLDQLARAHGVVFDVRGYPTDAGGKILPYLIDAPENDRWMHVAQIVGPFGQSAGWQSVGWNLRPSTPRLTGKIVFLTDGRAISYAESLMGYVADRKLGTIVGSTTAGTNGNVATFSVPGGFTVTFTGMRVTGHDGRTPHHLVGIRPDVPVAPTLAGVREGRDEVLDRALALVSGR
jgi:C-terminal processing protease CtpA/Prc